MFNKKFKLIGTAIGLVAVLMMVLALPGATQEPQSLPTRDEIVKRLSQMLSATLTASEGDILDVENAVFSSQPFYIFSDSRTPPRTSSFTYARIPLHPSSRSAQLHYNWLTKDEPFGEYLNLGALYTETDFPGCPGYDRLKAGIYKLKVRQDLKLIATDPEGNEFVIGYVTKERPETAQTLGIAEPDCPWCIIGGAVGLLICAFTDNQFCTTKRVCVPIVIGHPDGSTEVIIACHDQKECWGC